MQTKYFINVYSMIHIIIFLCMICVSFGFGSTPFFRYRFHKHSNIKKLSLSQNSVNGEDHAEKVHTNNISTTTNSDTIPLRVAENSDANMTSSTNSSTAAMTYGTEKRLYIDQLLKVGPVEKFSPPLTFKKYLTMQEKRVNVTIRYSNVQGMRPFYLTVATLIKSRHGDVILEKELIPVVGEEMEEEPIFEVIIDGKVVVGKSRSNWQPVPSNDRKNLANGLSVFIPMEEVNLAIAKARRRRRPTTTVYAQSVEADDGKTSVRLEMKKRGRYKK